jgi:hypothetical protein
LIVAVLSIIADQSCCWGLSTFEGLAGDNIDFAIFSQENPVAGSALGGRKELARGISFCYK